MLISMLLFSLALSLDGFGVGLSYGLRKIKITAVSFLIICLSSGLAVILSMSLGTLTAGLLPQGTEKLLGAAILILVGSWIFMQSFILNLVPDFKTYRFHISNLGLVINILKEPVTADLDHSGVIDVKEALLLGSALAMDALAAGFGAAISGYSPWLTPLFVIVAKFTLVSGGLWLGRRIELKKSKGILSLFPGGVIMLLGFKILLQL